VEATSDEANGTPNGLPKYTLILNATGVLNGVIIVVAGIVYRKTAQVLTNWENWRTESEAEAALIQKRFTFEFVNSYISLFYIAFVKPFIKNKLTLMVFPLGYAEVVGYKRYHIGDHTVQHTLHSIYCTHTLIHHVGTTSKTTLYSIRCTAYIVPTYTVLIRSYTLTHLHTPYSYSHTPRRYYIEDSHCMAKNCMYELALQLMSILFIKV
jgi:hypothetical protein